MKSALIIHSLSTYNYAEKIAEKYGDVKFLLVKKAPTQEMYEWLSNSMGDTTTVIGIGGGSVIDTAKMIARPNKCIAIPTTACGAAMTPWATVWGEEKKSIECLVPIMKRYKDKIDLPDEVSINTFSDAYSHVIESQWSNNATEKSKKYSNEALVLLVRDYFFGLSDKLLIKAGNYAGQAIAITKTNIIHAMSYPLTSEYDVSHGEACKLLFPHVMKFMKYKSSINFYSKLDIKIDAKKLAKMALRYPKIHDTFRKVTEKDLIKIYEQI